MCFGESVFSVGFNQKTAKEDLFVKRNHEIPPRKQRGETLEDSRRRITKAEPEPLTSGAGQPMGSTWQPLVAMLVLHRLKDCIFVVYSSRFDPKAQD